MSVTPIRPIASDSQVPIAIILCNEEKASIAYRRYSALRRAERDDPSLMDEECFQILVSDAYRSFAVAFDKIGGAK